jgi:hypothetical protein
VEQYDLDIIDDEESPCDALQRMTIGEVRPQDLSEQQVIAPNDTTPLAQDHDQDDEDEKVEDQEDENEDEQDQPHDEDQDHDQEESNDQGGAKDDGVQERSKEIPPHPRVRHTVQRDHPVDNIFGDIKNGVTTRSRVATFYQHYSFVFSLEPFKVEDTLRDPDWVVAMKEELNNFKSNEVWSLVERTKQNIVGTK